MKILIFTENFWPGGMDTFIITLINNWPHKEDDFTLCCNNAHPGLEVIERRLNRPCKIIRHNFLTAQEASSQINKGRVNKILFKGLYEYGRYVIDFLQFLLLFRLIRRLNPHRILVCCGNYPGGNTCRLVALTGLLKARWGRPLLVYHNDPTPPRLNLALPEYLIDFLVGRSVSHMVTVSRHTEAQLVCRTAFKEYKRKKVIYNGIELPDLKESEASSLHDELGLSRNKKIILMLSTYEKRKGHEFLFKALKRVIKSRPEAFLLVAGYGYPQELQRVETLLKQSSLTGCVKLLGYRNDVPRLLKHSSLLVVPSQAFESFGLTSVEALSRRVPVVTTRVGGLKEVIKEGYGGYAVPEDRYDLFAEKMVELLAPSRERDKIIEKGYKMFLEKFSAERMCREYVSLLKV